MSFFRRASEPSARETFLVAALAKAGVDEAGINSAFASKDEAFLGAYDSSAELAKANEAIKDAQAVSDARQAKLAVYQEAMNAAGFKAEEFATGDAFKAAIKSRIDTSASEQLVEMAASRGIKPVKMGANDAGSGVKEMSRSEFEKLPHSDRNAFMSNGGKLIE